MKAQLAFNIDLALLSLLLLGLYTPVCGLEPLAITEEQATVKPAEKSEISAKMHQLQTATRSPFGTTKDGEAVEQVTLRNADADIEARIITYGATLTAVEVPDKAGKKANVVLGFDNLGDYESKSPYFGATVGRCANRIADAKFVLDGKTYVLDANNGPNTLHGGLKGFDKRVWKIIELTDGAVTFALESKDMEEGFPGNLSVTVKYALNAKQELKITYAAETDKATPVNLTNHAYFNLAGAGNGNILDHRLIMHCERYTPVNATLIPTGEIAPVAGTAFDFTDWHKIGERIEAAGGYDHNFVINRKADGLVSAAEAQDSASGRSLEILTTEPGVQFYSGNFLDGTISGTGGIYKKHFGFTFEAQHYPDSVHQPEFPSIILRPGQKYSQVTVYKFSAK